MVLSGNQSIYRYKIYMITVYTPFQRKENIELMTKALEGKANWIVIIDDASLVDLFPEWVVVRLFEKPPEYVQCKSNWMVNRWIRDEIENNRLNPETQYMILCDDDSVEEGFFDKIPDENVVCVSMKRGDRKMNHVVWTDYKNQMGRWEDSIDILYANSENMQIACVGGEQVILKGKVLRDYRYGLSNIGDGEMIEKVKEEWDITYVPDAYVLFNYFEDGRYESFQRPKGIRTKHVVLFVGDYFCAGSPKMGISEWEGNIWASLESTGYAQVARFHFDKYYYHTGQRPDQALIDRIVAIQPDFIVMIIYRPLGSNPTVIHRDTLGVIKEMGIKIITIWGDLEAKEQREIAESVKPFTYKNYGTANKEAVESVGFEYVHVPKDPRIWNNPNKERDIDVLFLGSYGLGREERQRALQYLIDNGIKLVVGGSEGRDHFPTEAYADGYKRAKIAISFSRAHGMNVVNARVFEAMNCGAMLLEQDSPELEKLYTKDTDYKEWTNEVDLLEKVKYYLAHDDERYRIASNGYAKTQSLYSAQTFWNETLK